MAEGAGREPATQATAAHAPNIERMADFDHSHITPDGYLKSWAVGKHLAMRLVEDPGRALEVAPKDAGVRRGFTRERQPDGSYVNRLDPAFGQLESIALPLLSTLDERWPVDGIERGRISELIAIQVLRSPAWRSFHAQAVPNARENVRPNHPRAEARHFEAAEALLLTDRERHGRLLWQSPILTTIIANMHWTLLRTGRPRLVTSDHPVVPIGLEEAATSKTQPITAGGLMNTLEFRFAARPDLLLVMSWHDAGEDELPRRLAPHHIRNHNSLVIAQAERQWFHHPDVAPAYSGGAWHPISTDLHRGYGAAAARGSQRRAEVERQIAGPLGSGTLAEKVPVMRWPVRRAA
jgi:Protein of unknown function (DUF4238)